MSRLHLAAVLAALAGAGVGCDKTETVTAPALSASCAANPSSGVAPLNVSFTLNVSGAQGPFTVAVSYGDGTSGADPDQPHVFAAAGTYTASFTVTAAGQSARCAATVIVGAPPPPPPNLPPVAVFKTDPDPAGGVISGPAPFSVRFNLCASHDPELDPRWFTMDFDGDGQNEINGQTGAHCRRTHVYSAGTWRPRVCVTDVDSARVPLHPYQCKRYTVVAM